MSLFPGLRTGEKRPEEMNDDELLACYTAEARKRISEEVLLKFSFLEACILVGQLQLALRHPQNLGPARDEADRIIQALIAGIQPGPAIHEIFRRGAAGG